MQLLDSDIQTAKALIIDANPTARSVLTSQLRDLGVQNVRQISRVRDARVVLEETPHDIVLCEMSFHNGDMSGQDLLDELRREQLLPYHTVFMLVTGEATYAQVREAAEATVDGYLVKPYSAQVLADKLAETRRRKRKLRPMYEALQGGEVARAAALAETRFNARETYWNFSGQVAGELWLRADQPKQAMKVYNAVLAERPQAWARAGVARARMAMGEMGAARRLLEALVQDEPDYADGHDLLGRLMVEQGEFGIALERFRQASTQTPGCLLRMQHWGTLAFYQHENEQAVQQLERTVSLGRKSRLFDALCLALLGMLKFDARDSRGVGHMVEQIQSLAGAHAGSVRLERMKRMLGALAAIQARQLEPALATARALATEVMEPGFDVEAATLVLGLWVRLPRGEQPLDEFDQLLRQVGLRFSVSKATTELLVASANQSELGEELLRRSHGEVTAIAEQAMSRSLAGHAEEAVQLLLGEGERTRNAKLIELAGAVARRHPEQVGDLDEVLARVKALQDAYCAPLMHLAGMRRSARMPGGVVLRT